MTMATKEQAFFNALRDIFIGVKVEGRSGFVRLMRIKALHYEKVIARRLRRDITEALRPFPEFREELFDRLYTFFRRYFRESGSIYFRFTPPHEHVYEKIYTDERDVVLFWKTHMLYYVKTDRLFHDMRVEVDGFRFFFDVSTLVHKQANEKRSLVFTFKARAEDGTLAFTVAYSERGRKTKPAEIRRAIRDAPGLKRYTGAVPSEETLVRAFRLFERQSEVDYFINKDARRFLREQFDLWLYQYVFEPGQRDGSLWNARRIRQLQVLKQIAYKTIDFIAQFEDELVKVWNKPKFVLGSHYVITLDRIAAQEGGEAVLAQLLAHPGMTAQVAEWRELGMVGDDFTPDSVWVTDLTGRRLHDRYQYLPLDTKHFPDLEVRLLALFDHLDRALDGRLVHSENYQALNTMRPKFRERVQCIYIDPPYNTGNDEFVYDDRFRHSSWLTMMENRLRLAREWMREDGAIFVSIDDDESHTIRALLNSILGRENFKNLIVVRRGVKNVQAQFESVDALNVGHEYVLLFGKTSRTRFPKVLIGQGRKLGSWNNHWRGTDRPTMRYELFGIFPKRGQWRWSKERSLQAIENYERMVRELGGDENAITQGQIDQWWFSEYQRTGRKIDLLRLSHSRKPEHYVPPSEGTLLSDLWEDIQASWSRDLQGLFGQEMHFSNPKSVKLVERVVTLADQGPIILDFFAGSGTTAHAVINLNREDGGRRRYILVEMADYFHTVLLPRIKKVVFSDKWKEGRAQPEGRGVSHFVKYFRLEQYEETLRKAHYREDDEVLFVQDDPYTQYIFMRDPKMLDNGETGEPVMTLDMEADAIRVDLSRLYEDIDLAETLSCLTGRWVRRIRPAADDPTRPGTVEFEDGTTVDLRDPPWEWVKPLIWW